MKQTASILTGLILVVLLATGFIVADNIDLNRRVVQQENELLEMHAKLDENQKLLKERAEENKAAVEAQSRATTERDALTQQLNEAVLASQQAHENAQTQARLKDQARFELEVLKKEYQDLSAACAALEAQIGTANEKTIESPERAEPEEKLLSRPVPIRRPDRFMEY